MKHNNRKNARNFLTNRDKQDQDLVVDSGVEFTSEEEDDPSEFDDGFSDNEKAAAKKAEEARLSTFELYNLKVFGKTEGCKQNSKVRKVNPDFGNTQKNNLM